MTGVDQGYAAQAELLHELLGPKRRAPKRWWYPVIALVVLVAAGGVFVLVRAGSGAPAYPSKWDSRATKYVDFVEQQRGLKFQHPVYVDFLSDSAFAKSLGKGRDDTDVSLAGVEPVAGALQAAGLAPGTLSEELTEALGGVLGTYSYADHRIRLRGTEVTPAVGAALVRELTSALDDQSFDLDGLSSRAGAGLAAVTQGDALRIENAWRDGLSQQDRTALDQEVQADQQAAPAAANGLPPVVSTLVAAPPALGAALLDVATQQGGGAATTDVFRSPPTTQEQLLDPWTMLTDHQGYLTVPPPSLPAGAKASSSGTLGSVGWLLLLSARLPAAQALAAADGWGGDSFATYEQNGVSCLTADYRGDTVEDLTQMSTALQAWAAAGPAGAATVTQQDQVLVLDACDPGQKAGQSDGDKSAQALSMALVRTRISLRLVQTGTDVPTARCGAERLVRTLSAQELADPGVVAGLDPKAVDKAVQSCQQG